jgi:hypothetical protein
MSTRRSAIVAVALILAAAGPARADVVVSNLSDPSFQIEGIDSGEFIAQSFSTGGQGYTLTDIQASLAAPGGEGVTGPGYLYGDSGGHPGSLLATFTSTTLFLSNAPSTVTFTTPTSATLQAGQEYWFELSIYNNTANAYGWALTPSTSVAGVGSLGTLALSSDGGASWTPDAFALSALLQVDGTPFGASVTEPSSALAVGFAALAALGVWARRRAAPTSDRTMTSDSSTSARGHGSDPLGPSAGAPAAENSSQS